MKTRKPLWNNSGSWLGLTLLMTVIMGCGWLTPTMQTPNIQNPGVNTPAKKTVEVNPTLTLAVSLPTLTAEPSSTPKPAWEWPCSSPEEQGISSARLADMLEKVGRDNINIHSILVIRHGSLVMEAYKYPFKADTRHAVYSVTKSITSTLVGIASAEGLIDVQAPVVSYFPSTELDDPAKKSILIEHLLSMDSGVEWMEPLHSGLNDHWGILESKDPVQYFFTPALLAKPGTLFNYNSGGSHLLSVLLQEISGQSSADFAASKLFSTLDIRGYHWLNDFSGHSQGGTGLELSPRDMAKIGQLMLDNGKWQGNQVLPAEWVKKATQPHVQVSENTGYGYQWWVRSKGDYYALGWGGQQIHIFPKQDLVVVITAGVSDTSILHTALIDPFLVPAVKSNHALSADPASQARLKNAVRALSSPKEGITAPQSPLENIIKGKQWLVTGQGDWSMFSLDFLDDKEARLNLELATDMVSLLVGLDGFYRITDTKEYGPIALLGYWESADTFALKQQNLREADWRLTRLKFTDSTVKLFSEWHVEPYQEESEAVIFGK